MYQTCKHCGGPLAVLILIGSSTGPSCTVAINPPEVLLDCGDCRSIQYGRKSQWVTYAASR